MTKRSRVIACWCSKFNLLIDMAMAELFWGHLCVSSLPAKLCSIWVYRQAALPVLLWAMTVFGEISFTMDAPFKKKVWLISFLSHLLLKLSTSWVIFVWGSKYGYPWCQRFLFLFREAVGYGELSSIFFSSTSRLRRSLIPPTKASGTQGKIQWKPENTATEGHANWPY